MRFYSQFGEDKIIFERIKLPEKGVFVDVGAGDPIINSNTYFFEKRGWTGICIDPDPKNIRKLIPKRKEVFAGAIMDYTGTVGIDFHPSGFLSRVSKNGKSVVPCFRLKTVLHKAGIRKFDLLSIDVEGQELKVLAGMPKLKHENMPKVVIIEHKSHIDGDQGDEIIIEMEKLNYSKFHETQSNLIFKKNDQTRTH